MRKKLFAAFASAALVFSQAATVYADYGYDYGYGYDDYGNYDYGYDTYGYDTYGYDDGTSADNYNDGTGYTYSAADDGTSSADPTKDQPATVVLEPGKIEDKKFSAKLKINSNSAITAADITVSYDPEVFKVVSSKVNEEAGGEAVATELSAGTFQYIYTNALGSEWEEEYLTVDFEIVDPTERSSALYITVNSLLNTSQHEITATADGTVIQIEGAVPVDASADESMYSELRVAKIDRPISYDSLGLKEVKAVTFEDGSLATADENGITTLAEGITNMTVEFNDGTFKYYRLVISAQKEAEQAAAETASAADEEQPAQTESAEGAITKTQTGNAGGVMKIIIFVVIVLAVAAIVIEYIMIVKKPFTARKPKQPSEGIDDDDFFPEASDGEYRYEDTEREDEADSEDEAEIPEEETETPEDEAECDGTEYPEDETRDTEDIEETDETEEKTEE